MAVPPSGDYAQTHVPMVFVEQNPPPVDTPKRPPEREGGLVISRGFLGVLVVLLLGAAIAGTGGFYWLWQGALKETKTAQSEVQLKLDAAQKTNKLLTDEKATLTASLDKAQQSLVPYGEIERLKAATQAERSGSDAAICRSMTAPGIVRGLLMDPLSSLLLG